MSAKFLSHLAHCVRCLTLFVTHYPKIAELKDEFPGKVGPYFVSYLAEDPTSRTSRSNPQASMSHVLDNYKEPEYAEEATQKITFLYKLVPGVASRSFGLHVARLAQVGYSKFNDHSWEASRCEAPIAV